MSFVNVPEAPGSTGQNIESVIVTSSQHRQTFTVGSFNTTAMAPVTSSGGLLIHVTNPSTAVTITNPTTAVSLSSPAALSSGTVTLSSAPLVVVASSGGTIPAALSSGTVTLSSVHTVTATAGTNPWSSAPGFNIPFVSASSGALQISGTPLVNIVGTSSGVAPVTTSGGLGVTILGGAAGGSTTVNLSSATALSSGIVTLSSVHTVTATAGTNPWSSAPGFNIPFVSASSGLLQISGTPLVNIVGTSSGVAPVTTSGGLGVTILGGAASGSTAINIVGSSNGAAVVTTSGGLAVTIVSGGDLVAVVTTSGGFLTATTSYGLMVQATQGTGPWSSAPGFNIPFVSASSGLLQISGTPLVNIVGTSSGVAPVTTSGGLGVTILGGAASGSTTVNLSSATALSSGIVTLSSVHTVTATAGTNPWSSAPGFNVPIVSASSGIIALSSAPLVIVATSGGTFLTALTSGTVTLSSAPSLSSGTVTLSSAPLVIVASSGGTALRALTSGTVTLSSVHTMTATAATNPWSSAPSFNVPIVSVSSGTVNIVPSTAYPTLAFTFGCSSSASQTTVSTAPKMLTGWAVGSVATGPVKLMFYNSTSITHGSTTNLILSIPVPGSTGLGAGSNLILPRPVEFDSRMSFVIFDDLNSTSTTLGTHGAGQIMGTIFVTSS